MMWLTWRQFRPQAIAAAAVLAVLAVVLLVSGLSLAHLYNTSGVAACLAQHDCESVASGFLRQATCRLLRQAARHRGCDRTSRAGRHRHVLGRAADHPGDRDRNVPAGLESERQPLPLDRREARTHRPGLDGRGRGGDPDGRRGGPAPINKAVVLAGSASPTTVNRFTPAAFAASGIVPVGYAAFAFALGVTAGVLVRRTVPAMAVTLAAFAAIQLAWPTWIRPHLIAPVHAVLALSKVSLGSFGVDSRNELFLTVGSKGDGWILSSHAANAAGQAVSRVPGGCSTQTGGPGGVPRLPGQEGCQGRRYLSARQPLLGLPVV